MANAASLGRAADHQRDRGGRALVHVGIHMWKGTAPSLKARPATTNTTPNTSTCLLVRPVAMTAQHAGISSVPVAPYIIRHAVQQEARWPARQHEVLHRRLGRHRGRGAAPTSAYSDSAISFRPKVHREVVGRHHHHHAWRHSSASVTELALAGMSRSASVGPA